MLDLPSHDQTHYLAHFRLSCLFVAGPPSCMPPIAIACGLDLNRIITGIARRHPTAWDEPPVLHFAAWSNER